MKYYLLMLLPVLVIASACGRTPAPYYETAPTTVAETQATTETTTEAEITTEPMYIAQPAPQPTLEDILYIANARRHSIDRNADQRIYELTQGRAPQTINILETFTGNVQVSTFTPEVAIADARYLFALLQQAYGAYTYFGGDAVFMPILDTIVATLEGNDTWTMQNFANTLFINLSSAIRDNHFFLGGASMGVNYTFARPMTHNHRTIFARGENGFINKASGEAVAAVHVAGEPIDLNQAMRKSLSNDGELYYSLVIVAPVHEAPMRASIIYKNGYTDNITLAPAPTTGHPRGSHLEFIDNIPVVRLGEMGFPDSPDGNSAASAKYFLSTADRLQAEPIIIIDIRSNHGGNGTLVPRWLHALTGELIPHNYRGLRVENYEEFMTAIANDPAYGLHFICPYVMATYVPMAPFDNEHLIMYTDPFRVVENQRLFILLTNRHTASAGDAFADLMLSMENTLIIGQNTAGVFHTDLRFPSLTLPNSGLHFGFGNTINLHPPNHLPEGIGIAPDLWVNGDALTATLALLDRN